MLTSYPSADSRAYLCTHPTSDRSFATHSTVNCHHQPHDERESSHVSSLDLARKWQLWQELQPGQKELRRKLPRQTVHCMDSSHRLDAARKVF